MGIERFDSSYELKSKKYNLDRPIGAFGWNTSHLQASWEAGKYNFVYGAQFGLFLGLWRSLWTRKIMKIPKYAVVTGVVYGATMGVSQLYRFEI